MKFRTLGSTGMEVSVVGIGAWQFGGEWGKDYDESEVAAIVEAGEESGVNLIDTAECYGDHLSERLLAPAIAKNRGRWVIATKFGHRFMGRFEREEAWEASQVESQLEESLESLGTDHIDLYQFHSGSNEVFENEELWRTLEDLKKKGKVRHLGISVGGATQKHQAERSREVGSESIQVVYNRLERSPEEEVFPTCRSADLGVLARVPLASGFLSGKYGRGDTFPDTDVRSKWTAERLEVTLREVESIRSKEVPEGVSMAAWALAWCLRDEVVTSVIPGCKDPQQVRQNAAAADIQIAG